MKNYQETLRYRGVWMGLAMLWVVWYHFGISTGTVLVELIKDMGYGGVDLFIFASGIGCWYSLEKDPDSCRFLKRRIKRLAPAYWLFLIVWVAYQAVVDTISLRAVWGNILGIQNFTGLGGDFNWYISAILLYYILAPYLKGLADRNSGWIRQAGIFGLLLCATVPFWTAKGYIITVSRIPLFYLGMLWAKAAGKKRPITPRAVAVLVAGMIVGLLGLVIVTKKFPQLLWAYGMYWYPFILICPGACLLVSYAAGWLEKGRVGRWIIKGLETIGGCSFEIYLVHVLVFAAVRYLIRKLALPADSLVMWLAALLCTAIGSFLLKKAAGVITNLIWKKR